MVWGRSVDSGVDGKRNKVPNCAVIITSPALEGDARTKERFTITIATPPQHCLVITLAARST